MVNEKTNETFVMNACGLPVVQKRIAALNRRAAKMGLPFITIEVLREWDQEELIDQSIMSDDLRTRLVAKVEFRITGDSPKINGWTFAATIRPQEKGNLIEKMPDFKGEMPQYRTCEIVCEHCNVNRRRKNAYILFNEMTGEYKMVGSSCLKDFLGHATPQGIAAHVAYIVNFPAEIGDIADEYESYGGHGGYSEYRYTVEQYLGYVIRQVRENGFITARMARDNFDQTCTGDAAWGAMTFYPHSKGDVEYYNKCMKPSKQDMEKGCEIAAWTREHFTGEPKSDYESNMQVALGNKSVTWRTANLIASAAHVYFKDQVGDVDAKIISKAKQPKAEKTPSEYFGEVGKRGNFTLTVQKHTVSQGMYGEIHTYMFEDENDNRAVWFTNGNKDMLEGETYIITATIKKHDVFREKKQTYLTRCKVVERVETGTLTYSHD